MSKEIIYKQDAIDAVRKSYEQILDFYSDGHTIADSVEDIIDTVQPVPDRKKGTWEIYTISPFDGEGCRCSECGFEGVPYWDFCPGCGADMREEEHGIG